MSLPLRSAAGTDPRNLASNTPSATRAEKKTRSVGCYPCDGDLSKRKEQERKTNGKRNAERDAGKRIDEGTNTIYIKTCDMKRERKPLKREEKKQSQK